MCDTKLNKRDETKNIINNYSISSLITLMNSLVFMKRERLINEFF